MCLIADSHISIFISIANFFPLNEQIVQLLNELQLKCRICLVCHFCNKIKYCIVQFYTIHLSVLSYYNTDK